MAPIGEAYFPPLDRCLSGAHRLWSWELCFTSLSELHRTGHDSLKAFLSDPQSHEILLHPTAPFASPNPQTKSSFDTKTSAVNVSQNGHSNYDIKQIKEDSLWLSQETQIDEVSALRIAVQEWQRRPAAESLHSATSGPESAKLNGSVIRSLIVRRDLNSSFSSFAELNGDEHTNSNELTRHHRLVELLLSERCHILRCNEYILSNHLCTRKENHGAQAGKEQIQWLTELGLSILSRWAAERRAKGKQKAQDESFLTTATEAIRLRLQALTTGSGWSGLGSVQEKVEIRWGSCQVIEIVYILQIIQDLLQSSMTLVEGAMILPWFRLMGECGFLEDFQLPYPGLEAKFNVPLQSLAALVSLTYLNISQTLDLIARTTTGNFPTSGAPDSVPYILDQMAVNEINDILIACAPSAIASPSVMAWSIITQSLRETALATRESRETRQSIRAADKFGADDSSDTDGYDRRTGPISAIRRRSSTSSDTSQQSTLIEEIYDRICIAAVDEDPIPYLARNAVEGGKIFEIISAIATQYCTPYGSEHSGVPDQEMRNSLLTFIRAFSGFIDYQPALLAATLAVVNGSQRYWDWVDMPSLAQSKGPAMLVRDDEMLKSSILLVALSRFPYESEPILQLSRALALQESDRENSPAFHDLDLFTCQLPLGYYGYRNVDEEQEMDYVELTEDYYFDLTAASTAASSQPRKAIASQSFNSQRLASANFRIPRGTRGRVLSEGKPLVVAWNLEYSGLGYLGQVLACASASLLSSETFGSHISATIVGEAIAFLTSLLFSATHNSEDPAVSHEAASRILGHVSEGVDHDRDIVGVIFQILDHELYKPRKGGADETSLDVLVECVKFTHALLLVMPDRVWPFLGRSGLLAEDGGCLSAVVSSCEIVTGRYGFLYGCVRLFDALIEDCSERAVSRRTPSKAVARFGVINLFGSGVSHSIMEKVLYKFQRTLMDIFDSFGNWKFAIEDDRAELGFWLCKVFEKLLGYTYSINSFDDPSSKLMGALLPASKVIIDTFLSPSRTDLAVEPLVRACATGIPDTAVSLPTWSSKFRVEQTAAALKLFTRLVKISELFDRGPSHLQNQMFNNIKIFTTLYAAHETYKIPVVLLLDALVHSSSSHTPQPPSLLAHLGQENASWFLQLLSAIDKPVVDNDLTIAIWRLLGSIVGTRQQWFAHFILTGKQPRTTAKTETEASKTAQITPMLNLALDGLSHIERLESKRALAMLEFVALSVDYWPQMLQTLHNHPQFLLTVSTFASKSDSSTGNKTSKFYTNFDVVKMSSYIADILAMYTHWSQQEGSPKFAQEALEHLHQFAKNATVVPLYNASLHGNLRQNFASKYQGCGLDDFQRTALNRPSLGDSYYYNLEMATKMLSYDTAWSGRAGQGFADEVKRANLNLSVVEAQVSLFSSWKSFLIELIAPLSKEEKFQKILAQTVIDCLRANSENTLPEDFFQRLVQARADLAFTLLQTLNEVQSSQEEARRILVVAWDTLRAHNTNLGVALGADDADYHRTLVRILYLALQLHVRPGDGGPAAATRALNEAANSTSAPKPRSQNESTTLRIALEVTSQIVGQGFCSLTTLLHESPDLVTPLDFSLLTSILHACLQIPGVANSSEHLMEAFADTQTPRYAAALLSWADRLASSGDPIYGEISISFLVELSTVQALAESLAVEGVLSYILTSNIMEALQEKAFGPFDSPPRIFTIWSRGLLPLFLSLLQAVGSSIAAEVAGALNTFPHQLMRASQAFGTSPRSTSIVNDPARGYFTLSMAQEAHCLALIVSILRTFREAGASAAVQANTIEDIKWDAVQVKDDVEGWLTRRALLRDKTVPTNGREEAWARMKARGDESAGNRLEERVVNELRGVVGVLGEREG